MYCTSDVELGINGADTASILILSHVTAAASAAAASQHRGLNISVVVSW